MANLSTTPAEIIDMILPHVLPEDLENFAQCCKAVHQQANRKKGGSGRSLLEDHRTSIQKYSALTELKDVEPFLKAMTADQHLARYVHKMDFGPPQKRSIIDDWRTTGPFKDRKIYNLLISAAKKMQLEASIGGYVLYWPRGRAVNFWGRGRLNQIAPMTYTNSDLAISLLLPLLPNLKVLSFHCQPIGQQTSGFSHWIRQCITILTDNSVAIPRGLREVNLHSLDHFDPAMAEIVTLPSLQTLAVWHARLSPIDRRDWSPPQSHPHNNVDQLILWGCKIGPGIFCNYLESFSNLKSFHLNANIFNPMTLFNILLGHSGNSLTRLSLHSSGRDATGTLPFKQLRNLKGLWVDWDMLLPEPHIAGENLDTLLPQSLETLTIHDTYTDRFEKWEWTPRFIQQHFEPVVEALIACKTGGLPGIRNFSFSAVQGGSDWLRLAGLEDAELGFRDRCGRVGLLFSFVEDLVDSRAESLY